MKETRELVEQLVTLWPLIHISATVGGLIFTHERLASVCAGLLRCGGSPRTVRPLPTIPPRPACRWPPPSSHRPHRLTVIIYQLPLGICCKKELLASIYISSSFTFFHPPWWNWKHGALVLFFHRIGRTEGPRIDYCNGQRPSAGQATSWRSVADN